MVFKICSWFCFFVCGIQDMFHKIGITTEFLIQHILNFILMPYRLRPQVFTRFITSWTEIPSSCSHSFILLTYYDNNNQSLQVKVWLIFRYSVSPPPQKKIRISFPNSFMRSVRIRISKHQLEIYRSKHALLKSFVSRILFGNAHFWKGTTPKPLGTKIALHQNVEAINISNGKMSVPKWTGSIVHEFITTTLLKR